MITTYQDALQYLLSLPDWERGTGTRSTKETLLLERPRRLLDALGKPQTEYRSVIVAGTKGKGSTAAMLEGILRAAGFKTGLYSSPHLHTYRERVRVNGEMIPAAAFAGEVARVHAQIEQVQASEPELGAFTTFEALTAAALDYFQTEAVEVAILEVGLGGRLDATNVVEAKLALVTPISLDHMAVLGDTLAKIAREKAGIIKRGKPVLSAPQAAEATEVIEQQAAAHRAPLGVGGRDWTWSGNSDALQIQAAAREGLWKNHWQVENVHVPLRGQHQQTNAALAVAAAKSIESNWGWHISSDAVRAGIGSVQWMGRLETLRTGDSNHAPIVADGAHNGDSMEKLIAALRDEFQFKRLYVIFGVLRDKNLELMAAPLVGIAERVWTIETRHPRSAGAVETADHLRAIGLDAIAAGQIETAIAEAGQVAAPNDLICITGSLSAAAAGREALGLATGGEW